GVLMNNGCFWLDLHPGSPNVLGPRRRSPTSQSPMLALRDGEPVLATGTPGSFGALQATIQILMNTLRFGMHIQAAIEAPRWRIYEGRRVEIEDRMPADVVDGLAALGHLVTKVAPWAPTVGSAEGIARVPEIGVLFGGSDLRRGDGCAIGF